MKSKSIVIINYGMGNLGSIQNMLRHIGVDSIISSSIDDIEDSSKLILSGVGAFDNAMRNITDSGFLALLNRKVLIDRIPILGICLGMQLFSMNSEEGTLPGLGWINAETVRFRFDNNECSRLKIPHMGWNLVNVKRESTLFSVNSEESRFYFVHSYHMDCREEKDVACCTYYGYEFPSAVQKGNILGVQFHPEKSHKFGMRVLKRFAEMT
jgi:imidazole glycerol-phosphate synthase subunit HisH